MAVTLEGAGNDRLDYGDVAALGGLNSLTVAVIVTPSAIADQDRVITQWGGSDTNRSFIVRIIDTDEIGFIVNDAGADRFGRKTNDLNMTTGTTYRFVFKWTNSGGNQIEIWSGTSRSIVNDVSTGTMNALANSSLSVQVGHETDESEDGLDGDYSEIAMWDLFLDDWICHSITADGRSPANFPDGGILYARCTRPGDTYDQWGGNTVTETGPAAAVHPRITYPAPPRIYFNPSVSVDIRNHIIPAYMMVNA